MDIIYQTLVALATLMLTGLGLMSMFAPGKMVGNFSVEPIGVAGLSTIRSVIGGMFLSCVTLLSAGLFYGKTELFIAVAVILGIIAFGRIVSLAADGYDKAVIPPLVVEIVMVSVLVTAFIQL